MKHWKNLSLPLNSPTRYLILLCLLIPVCVFSQAYEQQLSFSTTGDQTISLGRYRVGTAIEILCFINGGWAQDGGVYHLVSDYDSAPKVIYRAESSISTRMKFHGYVDPQTPSYAFLFATWDNQSPNGSYTNNVVFTISSNGDFDVNNPGNFASAMEATSVLAINSDSENVGIGTTTPSEKLDVNGTIRSKEIKVEANNWPDYVFSPDYNLKSLEETETFIKENKRLPDMPSAEEVAENGIALGEMNRLLLEKVEELTLYVIELKNENEKQNELIDQLLNVTSK